MKFLTGLLVVALAGVLVYGASSTNALATTYGSGTYGSCQYQTCSISLSSSANVPLDTIPAGSSTTCTVKSDPLSVSTGSSTGYILMFNSDEDEGTLEAAGGATIPAVVGDSGTPAALTANTWGYRVDGFAGFGSGPTTTMTNSTTVPTLGFAEIGHVSNSALIAYRSTTAPNPDVTIIWYGLCINSSATGGSYERDVIYTALVN